MTGKVARIIDLQRWALRPHTPVPDGGLQFVSDEFNVGSGQSLGWINDGGPIAAF